MTEARLSSQARVAFVLLFLLMVVDFADRQVMVTAFPYLRVEFGLSDAQLGALVSVVSLTVALAAFPIALAVDRGSRVRAVAVMGATWSGATAMCALAFSYAALLGARVAVGLGQAGFGPAGGALLAAAFPAERRATVLGAFQAGAPIGIVTGAVVGSLVAAQWGWRSAFLVLVVPGLLLAVLFLRVRDYPTVQPAGPRARPVMAVVVRARSAVGAMLGNALLLVILSTLYTWLPTHLERAYGMTAAAAGVTASVVVLAGSAGTIGTAYAADLLARRDRRHRLLVPAVAALGSAAALGTAFVAMPAGAAQLLLVFAGAATVTGAVGPAAAVVLDVVQPGMRATAMSLLVVVQNLFGLAIGPALTGLLADRWGLTAALGAVAGLAVVAAAALGWASLFYQRDVAAAGP